MNRRALLALGLIFVGLRLLLVLSAADRIHAPDWAEAKHSFLGDQWITEGPPSLREVLAAARDSRNAAHGGFLPLSALYAALSVPFGTPDNQLALKLSAIAFATLGFFAWIGVAFRLGGELAGWLTALLLLFPPPIYLAGTLVTWGSHSEASSLLGLACILLLRQAPPGRRGRLLPALTLGCVAAVSSLLLPITVLLFLVWLAKAWKQDIQASASPISTTTGVLLAYSLPLLLSWLATGAPASSVTEEAGNSPLQLVLNIGHGLALVSSTLSQLVPLPTFGPEITGHLLSGRARAALDWGVFGLLLCAFIQILFGNHKKPNLSTSPPPMALTYALLLGAPALHIGVLLLLGPRRPSIELRYLLPLFPIVLVTLASAASWAWQQRASLKTRLWAAFLLGAVFAWAVPGLAVQASLVEPSRIGKLSGDGPGFFAWNSPRYIDADIGNVRYETAPGVNHFLDHRPQNQRGFALVPRLTAGQDLLRALDPPVLDPKRLLERILRDQSTQPPAGPERERIYENIGWALAVFAPERPGLWMSMLSHLGRDRRACAAGLGMGLSRVRESGCQKIHRLQEEDRYPAWAGALRRDSSFASTCPSPTNKVEREQDER